MIPQYAPMSSGSEFVLIITGMAFATAVLLALIFAITRPRMRRLELLREAVQNPQIDPKIREYLMRDLSRPGFIAGIWRALRNGRTMVVMGWFGLFISIAMLVSGDRDLEEAGIPFLLVSFAVLTIPFVLQELERKQLAARD